jgi:hypothetical protein
VRLAALLLLAWLPASAQEAATVTRADLPIRTTISGTVEAEGVFRLKSNIEGRVVAVMGSTFTWYAEDKPLALLANKELAAILDAHGTTGNDILEERWQKIYKPTKVRCPTDCYVLKIYAKPGEIVRPQGVIVEAAKSLVMIGHIPPEHAFRVKFNTPYEYWTKDHPETRYQGRIANYDLDPRGERGPKGGHIRIELSQKFYLAPGTAWEGALTPEVKKLATQVPTRALIRHGDAMYLAVQVSTGITTDEFTEVVDGVSDGRKILILPGGKLGQAQRYENKPDPEATSKFVASEEEKKKAAQPPAPKKKEPKPAKSEDKPADRDPSWGADPYEE